MIKTETGSVYINMEFLRKIGFNKKAKAIVFEHDNGDFEEYTESINMSEWEYERVTEEIKTTMLMG